MRYARLLSWTLFVLFFLVYLTAIKLVRGGQWTAQQHFIHQVAPLYTFQYPYQPSHQPGYLPQTAALVAGRPLEPVPSVEEPSLKEARELVHHHVTFEAASAPAAQPTSQQAQAGISRRHQLPQQASQGQIGLHPQHQLAASKQVHSAPSNAVSGK